MRGGKGRGGRKGSGILLRGTDGRREGKGEGIPLEFKVGRMNTCRQAYS